MRKPKRLRPYLPNTSTRLALVGRSSKSGDEPDMRAYWPMRLTQIIGGRRWSLSFIWHTEPHPILIKSVRDELIANLNKRDDA